MKKLENSPVATGRGVSWIVKGAAMSLAMVGISMGAAAPVEARAAGRNGCLTVDLPLAPVKLYESHKVCHDSGSGRAPETRSALRKSLRGTPGAPARLTNRVRREARIAGRIGRTATEEAHRAARRLTSNGRAWEAIPDRLRPHELAEMRDKLAEQARLGPARSAAQPPQPKSTTGATRAAGRGQLRQAAPVRPPQAVDLPGVGWVTKSGQTTTIGLAGLLGLWFLSHRLGFITAGGLGLRARLKIGVRPAVRDRPETSSPIPEPSSAIEPDVESLAGTKMPILGESNALRCPPGSATVADVEPIEVEATAVPRARVREIEGPPGMIRLLGGYTIEGTAGQVDGQATGVWAFLGLLAENRTTLLPRSLAEEKLWPDTVLGAARFPTLLRDTRAKLAEPMGRSHPGKRLIENIAKNGYRINRGLYVPDVWRLHDQLDQAAIADDEAEKMTALSTAIDLYSHPYLPDLRHEWAQSAARTVGRRVLEALTQLADLDDAPQHAAVYLERATDIDPMAEQLYRRRLQMYADLGRGMAVHHCYDQLNDELKARGRKPQPQTVQLYRRLTVGS